jgi:hypothetical protein
MPVVKTLSKTRTGGRGGCSLYIEMLMFELLDWDYKEPVMISVKDGALIIRQAKKFAPSTTPIIPRPNRRKNKSAVEQASIAG